MKTYRVMVPEFLWQGRMLKPGALIEADNTSEIITNLALGRIKECETPGKGETREYEPTAQPVQEAAPPVEVAAPTAAAPIASEPMTTDDMPTPPTRRRYPRRDTRIED